MDEKTRTRLLFEHRLSQLVGKNVTLQLVRNDVPMSFRGVVEEPGEVAAGEEDLLEWSVFVERKKDEEPELNAMNQPVLRSKAKPQVRMYFAASEVYAISEHLETEEEAAKELGIEADGTSRIAQPLAGGLSVPPGYGR